ncbi:hypothetical protein [Olivibacter domesticus]|uniref:Uncharacterized protein n=1 Tax=Olivibacter domesticus TaxID=407022 RepID=A0A1H7XU39_OLID1|nr:hypothetical protein [Olivibacter domesticus]SEM37452.1 hypothetical protein SAMN05661044_05003 [Olivibacter domesticus]
MEHMQDRGFDEKLREKIGAFTPNVPEHLWYNIEKEIDEQPKVSLKRRNVSLGWIKIAASIGVVLVTITLYVKKPHEVIYLSGKAIQQVEQKEVLQPQIAEVATTNDGVIELHADKPQGLKEEYIEQKPVIDVAVQDEQTSPHQPINAEITRPNILLVENHVKLPEHIASLALIPSEPVEETKLKRNKKAFAVSDVLNYVVASVNQGDKKVISFANDDEGILKIALDLKALKTKL